MLLENRQRQQLVAERVGRLAEPLIEQVDRQDDGDQNQR